MNIDTKKLIQTEFLAFAMKAFAYLNKGRSLGQDKYLKLLAERLARVAAGETKRLVVSLPPRHFKTFMGSICLPAWILAHNPSAKIVLLTYGQDLADKNAYAIRQILRSEWFQQAFQTRIKKDRAKLVDFITTDGGGVRSLSIEGGVTGLGADYIIIDDPIEIKDCDNTKRLKRVRAARSRSSRRGSPPQPPPSARRRPAHHPAAARSQAVRTAAPSSPRRVGHR